MWDYEKVLRRVYDDAKGVSVCEKDSYVRACRGKVDENDDRLSVREKCTE